MAHIKKIFLFFKDNYLHTSCSVLVLKNNHYFTETANEVPFVIKHKGDLTLMFNPLSIVTFHELKTQMRAGGLASGAEKS